jgi:hypothetical protein
MRRPNPYRGANCPTGIRSTKRKTRWPSGRSKDLTQGRQRLCPAIPLQGLMFDPTHLCSTVGNEPFEPHCAVRPCVGSTNLAFSPNASPCASSTSLARNSEPGVDFYGISTPFVCPPPSSHATASWRDDFYVVSTPFSHHLRTHNLAMLHGGVN